MAKSLLGRIAGWMRMSAAEARRFGAYQIVKVIHEGEKGFVYQARSPEDGNLYAVKVYKPIYNRTARRICKRYHLRSEGEIGLMLNPPEKEGGAEYPLVRTIGHGWEFDDPSKCYYLVQEYLEGMNVKHMLGCAHPLLPKKRLDIALTLARALAILHKRGVVHRDVCTDNLILCNNGFPKVIDLGFAAPAGIAFQEKSGTPSYMSPEQFEGRPLRAASDIYSFGVVLYEIFTGRLPFISAYSADSPELKARRTRDLQDKVQRETPPLPSEIASDLPDGMEETILMCIERAPEARPESMADLISELSQIQQREAQRGTEPRA